VATESPIVELDARTQKLDKALTETNKKLTKLDKQTDKNDKSFAKLSKASKAAAAGVTTLAAAGLAAATALSAVVLSTARSQRELGIMAKQTKLSTDEFKSLAFAAEQYGINAEQIADISKDLSDRLGEFGKIGTGTFQDFADVVGISKDEAMALAVEMQDLSSDQVIGRMVSQMEAAGASANEMTFVLESMGSDLSKLTPLFINNSNELKTLRANFDGATESMSLNAAQAKDLTEAATAFSLATKTLGSSAELISATVAPAFTEFFNALILVIPEATRDLITFFNTFRDAADINSIAALNDQIQQTHINISVLRQEQTDLSEDLGKWWSDERVLTEKIKEKNAEIQTEIDRLKELKDARGALTEVEAVADTSTTERLEIKLSTEKQLKDQAADEDAERQEMLNDLFKDSNSNLASDIKSKNAQKRKSDSDYFNAASTLGNAFFEDNKAVRAGLVVVDTAAGISKAFADLPYPAALAASASIAATGVAQLAAISSATKGSSGGGGGVAAAALPEPEDPTSDLNVQTIDATGEGQALKITFASDGDNDELAVALNGIINQAKVNGSIS
jgi:hypothetical protein